MSEKQIADEGEIVDSAGRSLHPRDQGLGVPKEPSKTWIGVILGSTTAIAFATAVLFYIGYVYYTSYFGSFGSGLMFPPMGTSDYLTKAFTLVSSGPMALIWSLWLGNLFVFSRATREKFYQNIERNAIRNSWLFGEMDDLLRKFARLLSEANRYSNPNIRRWELEYERDAKNQIVRKIKYRIDFGSRLSATLLNLPIWGTVLVVAFSLGRMGELSTRRIVWVLILVGILVVSSIVRVPIPMFWGRLVSSKGVDKYGVMFSMLFLVFSSSRLLAESVGGYDARAFISGEDGGGYVSILSPNILDDLDGNKRFRIVLYRDGNYYAIPAECGTDPVRMYVIPETKAGVVLVKKDDEVCESEHNGPSISTPIPGSPAP